MSTPPPDPKVDPREAGEPGRAGDPSRAGGSPPEGAALRSLIWAVCATPAWALLAVVPAALLQGALPGAVGWALILGVYGAAAAVAWWDRRLPHPAPPRAFRFAAPAPWMWGCAALAGLGVMILASEAGNVALSAAGGEVALPEGPETSLAVARWQLGLVWGLLHPWAFLTILCVVTWRRLRATGRARLAWWMTVLLGGMVLPGPLVQVGPLVALPVWLFSQTGSLGLALVAHLPSVAGFVLALAGVSLGIDGFDVVSKDEVLFQPVWFDLLGAALLVVGLGPLLRALEPPADGAAARR